MYYEEKVINGMLHYRSNPDGPWIQMSPERLTTMLNEARAEWQKARSKIDELDILCDRLAN